MTDPMKAASERLDELLGLERSEGAQIPGDIMQAALQIVEDLEAPEWDDGNNAMLIARALMAERLAERARCALIANSHRQGDKSIWRAPPFNDGCDFTARYIEKAILEGGKP